MNKILIVSKTRMQNNNVCVGGWDLNNQIPIRLLNANGFHESNDECPYEIGQIWEITYYKVQQRPLPHSEDVAVSQRSLHGKLKSGLTYCDVLKQFGAKIYEGDIFNVFEGKLKTTSSGSLFINNDSCPQNSTCFWICDRNIVRRDFDDRIRYNYNNGTTRFGNTIKFVGLDNNPIAVIPQGTLVRLSLAHWWKPEDSEDEERCYLQLSGYYL